MAKLSVFTCLTLLFAIEHAYSEDCVHIIYLKTGDVVKAGTDAVVSLKIYDAQGNSVGSSNLWYSGIMPSGHNYFERNNLDVFSIKGKCFASQVCKIELSQVNDGPAPGWYIEYLKVNTNVYGSPLCLQSDEIQIDQWLASDEPPYSLSLTRDLCNSIDGVDMDSQKPPHFNISSTI